MLCQEGLALAKPETMPETRGPNRGEKVPHLGSPEGGSVDQEEFRVKGSEPKGETEHKQEQGVMYRLLCQI